MNQVHQIEKIAHMNGFNTRDASALAAAYGVATMSDYTAHQMGAVILYKGTIVGSGCNSNKTDPVQKKYDDRYRVFRGKEYHPHKHGIHAEMSAIKSVPYTVYKSMNWKKATLYIYRISDGLSLGQGLAKPCDACLHAIMNAGIKTVVYSTDRGFAKEYLA